MKTKTIILLPLLIGLNAEGSAILVDLGTATTTTQAQANANQTNATLSAANPSVTYLFATLNDQTTSYDTTTGNLGDNNTSGIVGSQVRITATGLIGSGSLGIDPRDPTVGGLAGTFDLTSMGTLSSFSLMIEYLNSSGGALGVSGANLSGNNGATALITPMILVTNQSTEDFSLGLSLLDGLGSTITNVDYIGSGLNTVTGTSALSNAGVSTFEIGTSDTGSLHRFDDGTSALTEAGRADDLFSGIVADFTATDGDFADGSSFRLSFDSRILALNGVPEPSSALLLGLSSLGFLSRRKR